MWSRNGQYPALVEWINRTQLLRKLPRDQKVVQNARWVRYVFYQVVPGD